MRARSRIESNSGGDVAIVAKVSRFGDYDASAATVNPRLDGWQPRITAREAIDMSRLSRSIVTSLRDGAQSAREGQAEGLTYADGWAAAATLAELVAFDETALLD